MPRIEPVGNTCHLIDLAMDYIRDISDEDFPFRTVKDILEEIRDANSTLRNWGT